MRMRVWNSKMLIILLTFMFSFGNAMADAEDSESIMGSWAFETEPYRGGQCVVSGLAHIMPGDSTNTHTCHLTVAEQCQADAKTIVLQSCIIRQIGDVLSIRSRIIDKFEEGDAQIVYFPDHFQLKIIDGETLTGQLKSASEANVTFTRSAGGIS